MLPLKGMTVVDFSNYFPGAYCSRLLTDMGARVIKVERNVSGDPMRYMAGAFSVANAGKEGIAVDLSTSKGQEVAHRLIRNADILIEGFQPGITSKLGIDYETVSALKEDLIYCSITGFGQTGPLAQKPAHDISAMAEAGVLGMGLQTGAPTIYTSGVFVGDLSAAMFAMVSIIGAVIQKIKSGKGAYIDISMSDCCVSWISPVWAAYNNGLTKEEVLTHPAYGVFETKDGKYLAIAAFANSHWLALCKALNLQDLLENPSFFTPNGRKQNEDEINIRIADKISTREREYWLDLLGGVGVAVNPVNTPEELASHNHFLQRELFNNRNSELPALAVAFPALVNNERWGKERSAAPRLGQDTQRVLKSLGFSDQEVENFAADGII